jgi:hypothetical protein
MSTFLEFKRLLLFKRWQLMWCLTSISFKSWLMVSHKETIQQWQDGWVKDPYTSSELDSRPPVLSLVATS